MSFENLLEGFSGSQLFENQLYSDARACNNRLTHHDGRIRLNKVRAHDNSGLYLKRLRALNVRYEINSAPMKVDSLNNIDGAAAFADGLLCGFKEADDAKARMAVRERGPALSDGV
jgi:hypothetical protein